MPEQTVRKLKTYSQLATGRRVPSEYELVSSQLHYHYPHNFELSNENPVSKWYFQYRESSRLQASDWEVFADPRKTTYRTYNEIQDRKETVVDGLLRQIDATGSDDQLDDGWIDFLHRWYGPLRYPFHGLEMMSAYVAQMAPASRITNCAVFQSVDEMRRLQRNTYRIVQLHFHRGRCDPTAHREMWERAAPFQPLRELVETALIAYDWGEAFTVLNLVIKPALDRLINDQMCGELAVANHDPILRDIHFSLNEEAIWHRDWAFSLVRTALELNPANGQVLDDWIGQWRPKVSAAVEALASVFEEAPQAVARDEIAKAVINAAEDDLVSAVPALAR